MAIMAAFQAADGSSILPARTKGFTLIELMVVVSIISLLSSIVLTAVGTVREKARDTRRLEDMRQILIALELYRDTHGTYPRNRNLSDGTSNYGEQDCQGWDDSVRNGNGTGGMFLDPLEIEGYINPVPVDPLNSIDCPAGLMSGNHYRYAIYSAGQYNCGDRPFFVLGAHDMETVPGSPTNDPGSPTHPSSPGFSCNIDFAACGGDPACKTCTGTGSYNIDCRNWQATFEWVVGGFE